MLQTVASNDKELWGTARSSTNMAPYDMYNYQARKEAKDKNKK